MSQPHLLIQFLVKFLKSLINGDDVKISSFGTHFGSKTKKEERLVEIQKQVKKFQLQLEVL